MLPMLNLVLGKEGSGEISLLDFHLVLLKSNLGLVPTLQKLDPIVSAQVVLVLVYIFQLFHLKIQKI
jgi:hypothetical protein